MSWREINRIERRTYSALRTTNDMKAIAKGKAGKRIERRILGRLASQIIRALVK